MSPAEVAPSAGPGGSAVDADPWASLGATFVDGHYATLRGAVRTYVIDQHLRAHLPPPPAAIVDVGGGAGHQSLPLARDGYDVTIVDPSPAMLERAAAAVAAEPFDVGRRVALVEAPGEEAVECLGAGRFAGVLCHGVVMYLDDPEPTVRSLAGLAAPGGVVSVVAKNRASMAVLPALRGDWSEALRAFDADHQINGLGVETRADTLDGLGELFGRHGVDPVAWYGVRLFTDRWRDDVAVDGGRPLADVLAVELEASRRDPYRQLSRLFHLVGVRRPAAAATG
ncbi:MAG: methyltransferase [Acidimicrobiales bacterium]